MGARLIRSDRCVLRRASGGFTYLWTLALVAMLGVSAALVAEEYVTGVRRDREADLLFIGHEFRTALERYYRGVGAKHEYPTTLEELLRDRRFSGVQRHLRRIYRDPMTGEAEWGLVRVAGRIVGIHSLSGEAPLRQKNFDPDDAGLEDRESYRDWIFTYPPHLLNETKPVEPQSGAPGPDTTERSKT
jgi:type II secretory pathway pseudopilin PulG